MSADFVSLKMEVSAAAECCYFKYLYHKGFITPFFFVQSCRRFQWRSDSESVQQLTGQVFQGILVQVELTVTELGSVNKQFLKKGIM